jgi:hypothetical protein
MALNKRQVFYSFHFDKDVMRTQLVRNMGVVEGDTPASPNEWEQLKKKDGGQKKWIDDNMRGRSCVIVLVGEEAATPKPIGEGGLCTRATARQASHAGPSGRSAA